MQAIRYERYGGPEVLQLQEVDVSEPGPGEVRMRVHAASVNPYDFHFMRGEPLFMRLFTGFSKPRKHGLGSDVAGVIDAVGEGVTLFKVGDEVYGAADGAFAESALGKESELSMKPSSLDWNEAAALPMAAITALQGIERAGVGPGSRVLVNGASGGVGHIVVQMAKAMGAHVTAVCKASNSDWVKDIGADRSFDYQEKPVVDSGSIFDAIIDTVSNHSLAEFKQIMAPGAIYVWLGSAKMGRIMGPLGHIFRIAISGPQFQMVNAKRTREVMDQINQFVDLELLRPRIEHTFPLAAIGTALSHVEAGHTKGKTVVQIEASTD